MDAQLKAKWVKALRSGEYKQGRHYLRSNEHFCCLGVLCNLVDPSKWTHTDLEFARYRGQEYAHSSFPPAEVARQVNLTHDDQDHVASMNDEGKTFAEIADYIETAIPADVGGAPK